MSPAGRRGGVPPESTTADLGAAPKRLASVVLPPHLTICAVAISLDELAADPSEGRKGTSFELVPNVCNGSNADSSLEPEAAFDDRHARSAEDHAVAVQLAIEMTAAFAGLKGGEAVAAKAVCPDRH